MPYGGLPASGSAVAGSPAPTVPQLLSSFGDFQNIYGGYANLSLTVSSENVNPASMVDVNYMAMAVQAFFLNGGSALYVSRVFSNNPGATAGTIDPGIATSGTASASDVVVQGRFPGAFLNTQTVSVALTATRVLNFNNLANLPSGSLLGEPGTGDGAPTLYSNGTGTTFMSNATVPAALTAGTFPAKLYVLTVQVTAPGANGSQMVYTGLGLDPNHPSYLGDTLGVNPPRPIDQLQNQIWFNIGSSLSTGFGSLREPSSQPGSTPRQHRHHGRPRTHSRAGQVIMDSLGNIEIVTTAGTSGATAPTWNPNSGQTTVGWCGDLDESWPMASGYRLHSRHR